MPRSDQASLVSQIKLAFIPTIIFLAFCFAIFTGWVEYLEDISKISSLLRENGNAHNSRRNVQKLFVYIQNRFSLLPDKPKPL